MTKLTGILVAAAVALAMTFTVNVVAEEDAEAWTVYGYYYSYSYLKYGYTSENTYSTTSCYGACGKGCSYNCSSGGSCYTHDRLVRYYGYWSPVSLAAFPAAAQQWGRCTTGKITRWVWSQTKSRATNAIKSIGSAVKCVFSCGW